MKFLLAFALICMRVDAFCQTHEEDVKRVVMTAYLGGIHNGGPIDDIRSGFHPSFNMLRLVNNEVKPLPIEDWIKAIEKNRSENPNPGKVEGRFVEILISGSAANVALELYREGKKIFTDYLLLYQFEEGWRIVSKTYYRHP